MPDIRLLCSSYILIPRFSPYYKRDGVVGVFEFIEDTLYFVDFERVSIFSANELGDILVSFCKLAGVSELPIPQILFLKICEGVFRKMRCFNVACHVQDDNLLLAPKPRLHFRFSHNSGEYGLSLPLNWHKGPDIGYEEAYLELIAVLERGPEFWAKDFINQETHF